jgi:hypothetical protein
MAKSAAVINIAFQDLGDVNGCQNNCCFHVVDINKKDIQMLINMKNMFEYGIDIWILRFHNIYGSQIITGLKA